MAVNHDYADYLTECRKQGVDPLPRDLWSAPLAQSHKETINELDPYTLQPLHHVGPSSSAPMTREQQERAEDLYPMAITLARRPCYRRRGDDESESIVGLTLCEAVLAYDANSHIPLRDYAWMYIDNKLKNHRRRAKRRETTGTCGGWPSRGQIESHSGTGRRVPKSYDEIKIRRSRTVDESLPAKPCNPLLKLVPLLPKRLQPVAQARWVDGMTVRETAVELGESVTAVQRQCYEAGEFVKILWPNCWSHSSLRPPLFLSQHTPHAYVGRPFVT